MNDFIKSMTLAGIKIKEANGAFRGVKDVLSDLVGKWDSLSDEQKNIITDDFLALRSK